MELISLILNLVLSSGTIGTIIFFTSQKRKANAEATSAEFSAKEQEFTIQKENIEFLSLRLQNSWAEVEKIQGLLNGSRNQIIELVAKTKKLEIELIESETKRKKAELLICQKGDCKERLSFAA
ncbi:MAG: hypothetical protein R3Y61_00690 [Rikenellaceae bacterium]